MMFLSIIKKRLLIILLIILVLVGLGNSYVLLKNRNGINNKEVVQEQTYSENKERIKITNLNEIYDAIKDQKSCSAMIIQIDNSIQYINIILEDVPKAINVEDYYKANQEAINNIFALTTESEFSDFYKKIVPLQELDSYEILTNTIENIDSNYKLEVKLKGNDDITIPITICVTDANKLESSIYWNKG